MKKRLTYVSPLKLGITLGLIYAIISLVVLVPIFLLLSLIGAAASAKNGAAGVPFIFQGVFLLFLPVIYAVVGFIGGVIVGFIYNLISKWTGGIDFITEQAD